MADSIVWLNHAGYELRTAGLRIVHDPWLSGLAFDDGWALVAPSAHRAEDLAGADYFWFSHEHPDHFQPAVLRAIPADARGRTTVLYQRARDGRVARFCRELGYRVRELGDGEPAELANGVRVTCGVQGDDSWLFTETAQRTYFNPNDVVGCDWRAVVRRFARPVDVLLAQFSYASGVAAPGETARMEAAAEQQFALMAEQIAAARPHYLIPFASYMWFCRPENFHLNAGANRIDRVHRWASETGASPVVLYPGDQWEVGAAHDSAAAVARYMMDWAMIGPHPPRAPVPLVELTAFAREHGARLAQDNALWLLRPLAAARFVEPVGIWLTDLDVGVRHHMLGSGALVEGVAQADCDIELSSGSLAMLLRHGWGMGTLMVNGCYRELRHDGLRRLSRHFALPAHNARGDRFPAALLRPSYALKHGRRAAAAAVRQLRRSG